MKKLFVVFLAILSVTPAYADGGRGHGHGYYGRGYGWGWGGDWIFPALVGGALVYGLTQPPTVVQPQTIYLQPQPGVAPSSPQYWYFCAAANAYYPYVATCPGGWQPVPATPPAASSSMPPNAPAQ